MAETTGARAIQSERSRKFLSPVHSVSTFFKRAILLTEAAIIIAVAASNFSGCSLDKAPRLRLGEKLKVDGKTIALVRIDTTYSGSGPDLPKVTFNPVLVVEEKEGEKRAFGANNVIPLDGGKCYVIKGCNGKFVQLELWEDSSTPLGPGGSTNLN